MDKEVLDLLCCPICQGDLELGKDKLTCKSCSKEFIVKDGIPVLLKDYI